MTTLIEDIDRILPQTQCTQCGYQDCYSYATAIFNGENHNYCVPGGQVVTDEIGILLKRKKERTIILSKSDIQHSSQKKIAWINEELCVGCTKCILSCPVDAISGAKNLMHTIIKEDCTGCSLCVAPCPMDCIEMQELEEVQLKKTEYEKKKETNRNRYKKHKMRILEKKLNETTKYKQNIEENTKTGSLSKDLYIKHLLERYKSKNKLE